MKVTIIGVAGGSGSGKTTFVNRLVSMMQQKCLLIAQDNYYYDQSDKFDYDGGAINFDHPDSIDFPLMLHHLEQLKQGKQIQSPRYDFTTHTRSERVDTYSAQQIVVVDGILIFSCPAILDILDHKIFIECHEDLRFQRRLKRDTQQRGRTAQGVHNQFYSQVKPMHDLFVEPSKIHACDTVDLENFDQKVHYWHDKLSQS